VPPDNLLTPGSCVVVEPNGDAAEVDCANSHDGVVATIVAFDEACEAGLEPHRDRQGLGTACVKMS
jgi:molecular chaperone DnaJ